MEDVNTEQKSDKKYKDTFFRKLFHEEARALELANAIEGTDFPPGTPLRFHSNGDKSLTRRNNDLAFVVNNQLLVITDQQSTINPNMPLRLLPFAADILYTWLVDKKSLYKNSLVTIPTPKFYVLYNGKERLKNTVLRLSDAFRFKNHDFSIELVVKVIDVNHESGDRILRKSPSLNGYAYLVERIRQNISAGMPRDRAIAEAVKHCIENGILADFLEKYYLEVCDMFNYGITDEEYIEIKQEEAWEKGKEEGKAEGKAEGFLEAAIIMIQRGTSLQDVVGMFDLSDNQIGEINKRFA